MEKKNDQEIVIDFRRILYRVMRALPVIALTALLFGIAGYGVSAYFVKPSYEASADLVVANRTDNGSVTAVTNSDLQASANLLETYSVMFKTHDMLETVIADLDLEESYSALKDKISVSSVNSTPVMRITVTDTSAKKALAIVTDLVRLAPDAIESAVDGGSVTLVDQPWTTGKPVSPNIRRNTAIAALAGILLCLAWIVISEMLNDKFKTTEDVRNILDLQVLGVIPVEETAADRKKAKKKKARKKTAKLAQS